MARGYSAERRFVAWKRVIPFHWLSERNHAAHSLAWDQLRQLKHRIAAGRTGRVDAFTRVHLAESAMKIDRALDAKVMIGTAAPARSGSLLELLLGSDNRPAEK